MRLALRALLAVVLALSFVSIVNAAEEAICSSAGIVMCDNFEDRALGSPGTTWPSVGPHTPGWSLDLAGTNVVANDQAFTGTQSLKLNYPPCTWTNNSANCGAGQMQPLITLNTTSMYVRHYVKWASDFTWGDIGLKHFHHEATNAPVSSRVPWWNFHGFLNGGTVMYADNEGFTSQFFEQNQGNNIAFNRNQWYCLETHTSRTAAGVGTYELWIDGILRLQYTNIPMNTTVFWDNITMTGFWNTWGPAPPGNIDQATCLESGQPTLSWTGTACHVAASAKWIDNLVVSTQRIGCIGTAPPTPPGPPINLTVN